jgi:hypothetical protein
MIVPEDLVIDQPDGTDQALPWTLESYILQLLQRSPYHIQAHVTLLPRFSNPSYAPAIYYFEIS